MQDLSRQGQERLSRQQAAEQLTDIAYALVAGRPLVIEIDGRPVSVPIGDELVLKRGGATNAGRARLELELSWPVAP